MKTAVCFFVVLLNFTLGAISFYPWGERDHKKRNEDLLSALRNNLGLETSEASIIKRLENSSTTGYLIRDGAENTWIAHLSDESDDGQEDLDSDEDSAEDDIFNHQVLYSKLKNLCSILPLDYWNYEWCHQREVHQFHVEQRDRVWIKEPNWSLGKYKRTVVVRDLKANPSPIIKMVDYFEGGQICHEIDQYRSTEVHIQCCDGLSVPNYTPSDVYFAQESRSSSNINRKSSMSQRSGRSGVSGETTNTINKAVFFKIEEPSICKYVATICSPLLCSHAQRLVSPAEKSASTDVTSKNSDEHLSQINTNVKEIPHYASQLKELLNMCLIKQEEWWTYEFCVGKGVRQIRFNIETTTTADGGMVQKSVPVNEYVLGLPPLSVMQNESALVERTKYQKQVQHMSDDEENDSSSDSKIFQNLGMLSPLFKAREDEVNYLTLEYENGTACDLDNLNRSTTVELYCGTHNEFRLVREDSTCKYRVQIDLIALCTLPRFAPKKLQVKKITLQSDEDYFQSLQPKQNAEDRSLSTDLPADADYDAEYMVETATENPFDESASNPPEDESDNFEITIISEEDEKQLITGLDGILTEISSEEVLVDEDDDKEVETE